MVTDGLYEPYIDEKYRAFASKLSLTDTLPRLGIRVPVLRELSKTVNADEIEIRYHEDVILKGLAIGRQKCSSEKKYDRLKKILPYLSSWDQTDIIATGFKYSRKDGKEAEEFFFLLLDDGRVYPKRLGIVWILQNRKHLDRTKALTALAESDDESEYYISMAVAWAFSFFYIDYADIQDTIRYIKQASYTTQKRTAAKIRESLRYRGEKLDI